MLHNELYLPYLANAIKITLNVVKSRDCVKLISSCLSKHNLPGFNRENYKQFTKNYDIIRR